MPVDVTVTTTTGDHTFVVRDSLAVQSFQLNVESEPVRLQLDKDNWILKRLPEEFVEPTFDRGILLVNGVLFDSYDDEIRHSYQERAFWGDAPITFWDCFNPPSDGYPSTLPAPAGFGRVPAEILGQYSTVIWVGNDYGGDLGSWQQTAILNYLEAGGNVLLMTRKGREYLDVDLAAYLGITWAEAPMVTTGNCAAAFPGLFDMAVTGEQSYNAVFETDLSFNKSTLLFQETVTFGQARGLGVWRQPEQSMLSQSHGGHFVYIGGRPYRYHSDHLRANVEFILRNFFNESLPGDGEPPIGDKLAGNYPNPFRESTVIRYYINRPMRATIRIYNIQGKLVRELQQSVLSKGLYQLAWDGKNNSGKTAASGVYYCQLNGGGGFKKMLLLK